MLYVQGGNQSFERKKGASLRFVALGIDELGNAEVACFEKCTKNWLNES